MNRKLQNLAGLACVILSVGVGAASLCAQTGELLYNGIRLPAAWPPVRDRKDREEIARIPYLEVTNIPAVIPIDVGRQLFVDDFLIESTDLERTWHQAEKYEGNPVLTSHLEGDWRRSTAGPQHGGAFYDPFEKCFKIFYTEGDGEFRGHKKVAISPNGIDWSFPELGLYTGLYSTVTGELIEPREKSDNTYLLRPSGTNRSGEEDSIWLDAETEDPNQRYKNIALYRGTFTVGNLLTEGHYIWTLGDDYRPSSTQIMNTTYYGDYGSIAYNPFRKKWIQSLRQNDSAPNFNRARRYYEHDDYMQSFQTATAVFWADSDELDAAQLTIPAYKFPPELYSLNVVAYESIMLGVHQIMRCSNEQAQSGTMPKVTDLHLGFSRDGFHFSRPGVRKAFIESTQQRETWDRGYLHIAGGVCTVVGDKLYFFYTGFSGVWGPRENGSYEKSGMYVGYATGLATLRRDGFASMDAVQGERTLTSRPLRFKGKHMFVNVDCPKGELRAELMNENDQPIEPFTLENSQPVKTNSTLCHMTWTGANDLSALSNQTVKIRFTLTNGSLYAFWVSPDKSGASYGYVAAGGPRFTGNMDTIGDASLEQPKAVTPRQMKITFGGYSNNPARPTLTNFPVLVVLTNNVGGSSSFNYDNFATTSGYDLRFVTNLNDTTSLNYEIESWNTNGASYVWVQVPTIRGDGSGAIWAKWGDSINSVQLACTTNGATWSNGFSSVWHFSKRNGVPDLRDSTFYRRDGTNVGCASTAGRTGMGVDMESSVSDYVNVPTGLGSTYLPTTNTPITLSCWFKPESIGSGDNANRIINLHDSSTPPSSAIFLSLGLSTKLQALIDGSAGGTPNLVLTNAPSVSTNNWYYGAITYDGNLGILYQDGVEGRRTVAGAKLNAGTNAYAAKLGTFEGANLFYDGLLDEVRISSVARSTNWVWAEYLNMASNTAFNNYGGIGPVAAVPAAPTGLTATAAATNRIELAWTDNTSLETGYVVDRSPDSNAWSQIVLTAVNATNYTDSGLTTNALYYYRVAATNAAGLSAYCYALATTWSAYKQWRQTYFTTAELTNSAVSGDSADRDNDGMINLDEYLAGTDPTNPVSRLVLYQVASNPAATGEFLVSWQSATGRMYTLLAATNLVSNGFELILSTNIPATPMQNVYTDVVGGAVQKFYRVKLE